MLMALTPSVTSNIVPGSHFSPPLPSPRLVLPPRSSSVPSRLTCLYLITPFPRSLFLIVICFYASCSRCSDSSDTDAGRFFFSFPNFLPIKMSPMCGLFIFGLFSRLTPSLDCCFSLSSAFILKGCGDAVQSAPYHRQLGFAVAQLDK